MSDILRQISITTIPTTIENLARMAIFEVMPKGKFRVLASHQIDTHRISKLERTFSHDIGNIKGIVGKVANTQDPLLISDLNHAPDGIKEYFQTMEENKLPGQAPKSMLCIPILNTATRDKDSRCLAVLSISCSTSNAITEKQFEEVSKYANRARKLLLSMDSKILFDPQSSSGYRAITISGEVGSGKSTLVAELKSILEPAGWKIVSIGEKFREFCKINDIDVDQIEKLDDDLHLKYDEFQKNMLKEEELIIIEGRLSGYLGTDIQDVLTIYLNLPFEERVKRAMQRDETDKQSTEVKLKDRDSKDVARYKRLYKIDDYRDKKYYKLYLNTDDSPYNLAKKVLNSLKIK
jgi:cytidylate kinase